MTTPTDTLYSSQWYMAADRVDWGTGNIWDTYGYTGWGVNVGVFDNGVQGNHPDLDLNYNATLSWSPPGYYQNHGTAVAGVIAAERNGEGTVGIAYGSTIGSIPIFGRDFATEGDYVSYTLQAYLQTVNFDVVSQSWGYDAFLEDQHRPSHEVVFEGMEYGAYYGREALGTVFVSAAGNARVSGQAFTNGSYTSPAGDANAAGPAVESRYAIVVAGVGADGSVADYSNPGANVLVSAGAGGTWTDNTDSPIWTTDLSGSAGWNMAGGAAGNYTATIGTSFAAPQVSAIVALMLQANPDLGYRDVQEILAITARHTGSAIPADGTSVPLSGAELTSWGFNDAQTWNGGGMHFSTDYGFGMVDARAAVLLAETWTGQNTMWEEVSTAATVTYPDGAPLAIPDANATGVSIQFQLTDHVDIEQMKLDLGLQHSWAADLVITLTSPTGTQTTLLNRAGGSNDLNTWSFNANAFRGEDAAGTWTLHITDMAGADLGTITNATLTAYGSEQSEDDTYFFTDEFGEGLALGNDPARSHVDGGAGIDTVNAAPITSAMVIDLNAGAVSTIAGKSVTLVGMENAVGGEQADTLRGNGGDNVLRGGRGNDTIFGGEGNDFLEGGIGDDTLDGGGGNDTFLVSTWGHDTVSGGAGIDELTWDDAVSGQLVDLTTGHIDFQYRYRPTGSLDFTSIENVTGGRGGDEIRGDAGANVLVGGGGYDLLEGGEGNDILNGGFKTEAEAAGVDGNDTLRGGGGNDTIIASFGTDIVDGGEGSDTLSFAWCDDAKVVDLATGSAILSESGSNALRNNYTVWGGDNMQVSWTSIENLTGGKGNDTLYGDAGANVLDGSAGIDTLTGRSGHDTYYVDNAGDVVIEAAGQGVDTIISSVSYVLAANQSVELLKLDPATGSANLNLTGNNIANTIIGNAGANVLDGRAGADTMRGEGGDDLYLVDNAGDRVFEAVGGGTDKVGTTVSYALLAGQEIEQLYVRPASGTAAIDLTGNAHRQTLIGNAGDNVLDGGAGIDILYGLGGNDSFQFSTALGPNNVDRIKDFSSIDDTIRLDRDIFSSLSLGTLGTNQFKDVALGPIDADDRILYNHNTGVLSYDADGKGGTAAVVFAILDNKPATLMADDFFVFA